MKYVKKLFNNMRTLVLLIIFIIIGISQYQKTYTENIIISIFSEIITILLFTTIFSLIIGAVKKIITYTTNMVKKSIPKSDISIKNSANSYNNNGTNTAVLISQPVKNDTSDTSDQDYKNNTPIIKDSHIDLSKWYVSISFGKSSSANYHKAIALAKIAPQYHEQTDDNIILHQAIYSKDPKEFLSFIKLYELVSSWKSIIVMINGNIIDRKIIGNLNYCYGDKCRSGNLDFCYGASYMTSNPFGCHRLQISATNNPWWSFYKQNGNKYVLDKSAMKKRIDSYSSVYCICPCFNYSKILQVYNSLPESLTRQQFQDVINEANNM